jgi:hypothetical protein
MKQNGFDLQSAIDDVGHLCNQTLIRFKEDQENIPSWGPDIDRQVTIYVNGLASWIVGNIWWSVFTFLPWVLLLGALTYLVYHRGLISRLKPPRFQDVLYGQPPSVASDLIIGRRSWLGSVLIKCAEQCFIFHGVYRGFG